MAYVYKHIRKDTNDVFYIGISNGKKYNRAYTKECRNLHWYHIVDKHGYEVVITHDDIVWEEACVIESYLIAFYGRRELDEGTLVNMTDGGDGLKNLSDETKKRIRELTIIHTPRGENHWLHPNNITEEQRNRLSDKVKGDKNPACRSDVREKIRQKAIGRKANQETLDKFKLKVGDKNPFYNKNHTEETKKIMKEKAKGRYSLEWFINKYGEVEGSIKYQEWKILLKQSVNAAFSMKPMQRVEFTCPHCNLIGKGPNMKRYHFDNCKKILNK